MRIVRIIFGVLLLLAGAFCGGLAYQMAGGLHGWGEFNPYRLLARNSFPWTGAAVLLPLAGIFCARTGPNSTTPIGVAVAIVAVAVGTYGTAIVKRTPVPGIPFWIASLFLAVIAAVLLARRPAK